MAKTLHSEFRGAGLIPGQRAKIPHALRSKKNPKHETEAILSNKDFLKCSTFKKSVKEKKAECMLAQVSLSIMDQLSDGLTK